MLSRLRYGSYVPQVLRFEHTLRMLQLLIAGVERRLWITEDYFLYYKVDREEDA